jgi:hypothetical protein
VESIGFDASVLQDLRSYQMPSARATLNLRAEGKGAGKGRGHGMDMAYMAYMAMLE